MKVKDEHRKQYLKPSGFGAAIQTLTSLMGWGGWVQRGVTFEGRKGQNVGDTKIKKLQAAIDAYENEPAAKGVTISRKTMYEQMSKEGNPTNKQQEEEHKDYTNQKKELKELKEENAKFKEKWDKECEDLGLAQSQSQLTALIEVLIKIQNKLEIRYDELLGAEETLREEYKEKVQKINESSAQDKQERIKRAKTKLEKQIEKIPQNNLQSALTIINETSRIFTNFDLPEPANASADADSKKMLELAPLQLDVERKRITLLKLQNEQKDQRIAMHQGLHEAQDQLHEGEKTHNTKHNSYTVLVQRKGMLQAFITRLNKIKTLVPKYQEKKTLQELRNYVSENLQPFNSKTSVKFAKSEILGKFDAVIESASDVADSNTDLVRKITAVKEYVAGCSALSGSGEKVRAARKQILEKFDTTIQNLKDVAGSYTDLVENIDKEINTVKQQVNESAAQVNESAAQVEESAKQVEESKAKVDALASQQAGTQEAQQAGAQGAQQAVQEAQEAVQAAQEALAEAEAKYNTPQNSEDAQKKSKSSEGPQKILEYMRSVFQGRAEDMRTLIQRRQKNERDKSNGITGRSAIHTLMQTVAPMLVCVQTIQIANIILVYQRLVKKEDLGSKKIQERDKKHNKALKNLLMEELRNTLMQELPSQSPSQSPNQEYDKAYTWIPKLRLPSRVGSGDIKHSAGAMIHEAMYQGGYLGEHQYENAAVKRHSVGPLANCMVNFMQRHVNYTRENLFSSLEIFWHTDAKVNQLNASGWRYFLTVGWWFDPIYNIITSRTFRVAVPTLAIVTGIAYFIAPAYTLAAMQYFGAKIVALMEPAITISYNAISPIVAAYLNPIYQLVQSALFTAGAVISPIAEKAVLLSSTQLMGTMFVGSGVIMHLSNIAKKKKEVDLNFLGYGIAVSAYDTVIHALLDLPEYSVVFSVAAGSNPTNDVPATRTINLDSFFSAPIFNQHVLKSEKDWLGAGEERSYEFKKVKPGGILYEFYHGPFLASCCHCFTVLNNAVCNTTSSAIQLITGGFKAIYSAVFSGANPAQETAEEVQAGATGNQASTDAGATLT